MAIAVCVCACFITGCLSYRAPLKPSAEIKKDKGYLYGRFRYWTRAEDLRMAMVVTEQQTKIKHRIPFNTDPGLAVIDLPPGEYAITEYALESRDIPYDSKLFSKPFYVHANRMYYIGDYAGSIYWEKGYGESHSGYYTVTFRAEIDECRDEFDRTTTELRSLYKALAILPTTSVTNATSIEPN